MAIRLTCDDRGPAFLIWQVAPPSSFGRWPRLPNLAGGPAFLIWQVPAACAAALAGDGPPSVRPLAIALYSELLELVPSLVDHS